MKNVPFIGDLIRRFISKTPENYKAFQMILVVLTLITGIPAALEMYQVQLPETIEPFASKAFAVSSGLLAFLVQFAVANPQTPTNEKDQ